MDDLAILDFRVRGVELDESFETSGGPGGQHANRNATAVRLRFDIAASSLPDEVKQTLNDRIGESVEVVAADSRSQFRNRAIARQRLKEKLEAALIEQRARRPSKPTRASKRRRLEQKRARSQTKRLRRNPGPDD